MANPLLSQASLQRRTLGVLALAQIFVGTVNGLGIGAGSLFIAHVTGTDALGGMASTLITLGGAVMAAPLARLAVRRGRRVSLTTACLLALAATATLVVSGSFTLGWLALVGFFVLGSSSALNLQARFAAVDLSAPNRRGRDMSMVIWATTLGVVAGPSIVPVGDRIGIPLGLGELTGAYLLSGIGIVVITVIVWVLLRPDPLLAAAKFAAQGADVTDAASKQRGTPALKVALKQHPKVLWLIVIIAAAHATMVGIMALTPLHLEHEGQSLTLIMVAMSAHTGGMYILAPVFGMLADRLGKRVIVVTGAVIFASSIAANLLLPAQLGLVGLALLGFGWSAVTVSASAMLSDVAPHESLPIVQGRSDTVMGFAGAAAGAIAGPIVAVGDFALLNVLMLVPVVTIVIGAVHGLRVAPRSA